MSAVSRPPMFISVTSKNSSIPTFQKNSRIPVNNDWQKWMNKYEEAEQKRKLLLSENVKFLRDHDELQKRHIDLQEKHEQLETELFEKNEDFTKLTIASKNLYKEYETLKNRYDVETVAMSSALKDASQWYKQNKALKRRTLLIDGDSVDEGVDAGDSSPDSDIENLNRTIKKLSNEVATLQTEVECLKQSEFLINEDNVKLCDELEKEKENSSRLNSELVALKKENEQVIRVSELMRKELHELKGLQESQRNDVVTLRREAGDYKKERNVLAHQSTLLLKGISADNMENSLAMLHEVEELKRSQEEERNKYDEEIQLLQEKLEELDNNSHLEVLEERLKLVESELHSAVERAETAEKALENELQKPPLGPPPPPPPPPLPMMATETPIVPLRIKRRSKINLLESLDANGNEENGNKKGTPGVNEDIINAIKEGKFTLKKTSSQSKRERESSKTVSELLNILTTLKRAPKKRQSLIVTEP